ncbi:MAG: hypothetical protein KAX55_00335 [Propionivibrio sp.]|nr:hypothetical protein [Propionivibrio sp.]
MSTSDWPSAWGKQHEACCLVSGIMAKAQKNRTVELWLIGNNDANKRRCIGAVPEDVEYRQLVAMIPVMIESYRRGVADGRAELAASVLAPITAALQQEGK